MKNEKILDKCLILNKNLVAWKEIDGEIVFLHKKEKAFYETNKTANLILQFILKGKRPRSMIVALQNQYRNINKRVVEKDALDFIDTLVNKKILLVNN